MAKSKHNKTGNGTHRERVHKARTALELARKMAALQELQDRLQKEIRAAGGVVGEAKSAITTLMNTPVPVMAETGAEAEVTV